MRYSKRTARLSADFVAKLRKRYVNTRHATAELKPEGGYEKLRRAMEGGPVTPEYADHLRLQFSHDVMREGKWRDIYESLCRLDGRSLPVEQLTRRALDYLLALEMYLGGSQASRATPRVEFWLCLNGISPLDCAPASLRPASTSSQTTKRGSRSGGRVKAGGSLR